MTAKKESNEKILYIEPCAGLGNRLNAIVSAYYWAERTGFKLVIVWKKETACAADYDCLFENNGAICVKEINQFFTNRIQQYWHVYSNIWLNKTRKKCSFYDVEALSQIYNINGLDGIAKIFNSNKPVYIKSTFSFLPDDQKSTIAKRYLKFNHEITDRVHELIGNCSSIGLHIRRTDHAQSISISSSSKFEEYIISELNKNRNAKFYLATDDETEQAHFIEKFGDSLLVKTAKSKHISRISNEGMQDALFDILALSSCQKIYGSSGSTFSQWAAIIGQNELIIVE